MATNDIALIRSQVRQLVDPLLMRFREELYGSGVSYGKIQSSALPSSVITTGGDGSTTDVDDLGYIKGITTYSGSVLIGNDQTELAFENLGVTKTGGKTTITAPILSSGQYYTKSETQALLAAKANVNHTHAHTDITDWDTAVANAPAVVLNTAKQTNAFHTGDVVGSGYLTIQDDAVTLNKIADSSAVAGQVIVYSGGHWVVGYAVASGVIGLHAATHATGGIDELLPSAIGAATQVDHLALAGELAAHETIVATSSGLGHVIIGTGLNITSSGVLSAASSGNLIDPTTTPGDMLYRGATALLRLPIGASGTVLTVVSGLPVWGNTVAGAINVYDDLGGVFLGTSAIQFDSSVVSLVGDRVHVQPGMHVYDDTTFLTDRATRFTFGSGISASVAGGDVTVTNSAGTELAAHESKIASPTLLGHVKVGSNLAIDGGGILTWKGMTVSDTVGPTTLNDILALRFLRGRVQSSGTVATVIPAIRTETVLGALLDDTEILYFGDGITAVQSGTGRIVLSAGSATDFIVQTITDGLTNKAPSSDTVYDYFASNPYDTRYYLKSQIDTFLAGKSNVGHTHVALDITDFDTAVALSPSVVTNNAKISNATHVGEVTGSGYLTIATNIITPDKLSTTGAIEGYTIVYSGGMWRYGSLAGGVAINAGTIDAGSFITPGVTILLKRGLHVDFPSLGIGEIAAETDTHDVYIGFSGGGVLLQDARRLRGRDVVVSSPVAGEALTWTGVQFQNAKPNAVNSDQLGGFPASGYMLATHANVIASASTLGHIRVGDGLTINGAGILAATPTSGLLNPMTAMGDMIYGATDGIYPTLPDVSFSAGSTAVRIPAAEAGVEALIPGCDLTVTVIPGGLVKVVYSIWISIDHGGAQKLTTVRLRRDNLTGDILASLAKDMTIDSASGLDQHWVVTYIDTAPTTGSYVLSVQYTTTGGTCWTSTRAMDLYMSSAAGEPERLPIGAGGYLLTVVSGLPAWRAMNASGLLPDVMTTRGDIIYRETGDVARLPIGFSGQVLTVYGGVPRWRDPTGSGGVGGGGSSNVIHTDAWSVTPTAPNDGDTWIPSDSPYVAYRVASDWVYRYQGRPVQPPTFQSLTAVNQGPAVITDNGGAYNIETPATSASELRIMEMPVPGSSYKITIGLSRGHFFVNYPHAGICIRDSVSGKILTLAHYQGAGIMYQHYTGYTNGYNATPWGPIDGYSPDYLEIEEDATTRYFRVGRVGLTMHTLFTQAKSTWLTPDQIGFYVDSNNATYSAFVDVWHMSVQ